MIEKILGAILGAAVGDAMGAATETKSTEQISAIFNGPVTDFKTPPSDVLARGQKAGQVTDAFSIPYILTNHLIENNGLATKALGEEALIEWGSTPWFEPFAGMTTRKVINCLRDDNTQSSWAFAGHLGNKLFKGHYYALSSNGAASKAYPMGLFNPGNLDMTIADTLKIMMASHDDPYSISGACAISSAVSQALVEGSTLFDVVKAAQYGAVQGETLARQEADIWIYPGPSVVKRLEMAIQLAVHPEGVDSTMTVLRKYIGSGPAIAETVPTAIGLLIANRGDTMAAIYDGVNIGDETSAIASIIGAIGGALNGVTSIHSDYLGIIEKENDLSIRNQAQSIFKIINS